MKGFEFQKLSGQQKTAHPTPGDILEEKVEMRKCG